jgi:hypothetical protein
MLCKNCYIYQQKLGRLVERLTSTTQDAARFYGEGITKIQVNTTLNLYKDLKREWVWMSSITGFECPPKECLFVNYHFGVGRNTQLSLPWNRHYMTKLAPMYDGGCNDKVRILGKIICERNLREGGYNNSYIS